MADDNDDSWLYGGEGDEGTRPADKNEEDDETAAPVKNGNTENKTFDNTFDEHDFEVRRKTFALIII